MLALSNPGNLWSQSTPQNKYPYQTVDDNGKKIVIMTVEQANLINKKYDEIQALYAELELEHLVLKQINEQQGDTIVKQLSAIRRLNNLISELDSCEMDSSQIVAPDTIRIEVCNINDSLWNWGLNTTLMHIPDPSKNIVHIVNLSKYEIQYDDFSLLISKMSPRKYKRVQAYKQLFTPYERKRWINNPPIQIIQNDSIY